MNTNDPILQQCVRRIKAWYGPRLDRVVLFGSCARGDDSAESDIDLLVVLNGEFDDWTEIRNLVEILFPMQLESDRLISAKPARQGDYARGSVQFYRNVQAEAMTL